MHGFAGHTGFASLGDTGFAGHFAGTQKLDCTVEQRLGVSERVCGDTGFAGDTET